MQQKWLSWGCGLMCKSQTKLSNVIIQIVTVVVMIKLRILRWREKSLDKDTFMSQSDICLRPENAAET